MALSPETNAVVTPIYKTVSAGHKKTMTTFISLELMDVDATTPCLYFTHHT